MNRFELWDKVARNWQYRFRSVLGSRPVSRPIAFVCKLLRFRVTLTLTLIRYVIAENFIIFASVDADAVTENFGKMYKKCKILET